MKTKKINVVKLGFSEAKKKFQILLLPLSFFAVLAIAVLVLAFFAPLTLLLTVPFILIPSFFSITTINTVADNENTREGIGFFIMFRAYFTQLFRGGYKVIIGLLKALLVFVISSVILSAILSATVLNKDPGYIAFIQQIELITDQAELSKAFDTFVTTNKTFNNLMNIIYCCSTFLASYMFLHHFAVNSFKYNYNLFSKIPLPMNELNIINSVLLKKNRGAFYKSYYKAYWFLGLIFIVGYAAGFLLSFFFIPNIDMTQMSVIGLFGGFILLFFFIPYFLNASQLIFYSFKSLYISTLIELSKESLEELKKTNSISPEKEKEVLSLLESEQVDEQKEDDENDEQK